MNESGEILRFTHRQVEEEGFVVLFEAERVLVHFDGDGRMIVERSSDHD